MALITTTIVDGGTPRKWTVDPRDLVAPIGDIVYHDQTIIAQKLAADDALVTMNFQIPIGFAWRLVDFHVQLVATSVLEFVHWEAGMAFEINLSGVTTRVGQLIPYHAKVDGGRIEGGGYRKNFPTNTFVEHFILDQSYDQAFVTTSDTDQIFTRLVSTAGLTINAGSIIHHARLLQYTIDQFNRGPMNTPFPVI